MTTATHETPSFPTTTRHSGLRAAVILGLCAALLAGFVATSLRAPAAAHARDSIACSPAANGQKAC